MDNLIGKQLGPYRILEQIGLGGMTTVYKAYHATMDRYVAIKVLPAHMSSDPRFQKRFEREAKVIARLEHARILPVYDYGQADGQLYLVMRYIEIGTLKERLAAGPMDLAEVSRMMRQVGGALTYAHQLGVVHRDVKPSNVLLDAQGDCYLTDFGLSRIMESSIKLTKSGVGVGTPAYMSPEQGQGDKVDVRSDIYSLGVMLYEMVTGQVPYQAETPMAVVLKHISAPLPLPREVKPGIPQGVERVILKAMAKDPADRFQTAREMVTALDTAAQMAEADALTKGMAGQPATAKETQQPSERVLAQVVAGLRQTAGTGWGRAVLWTSVGILALLALYLVLSRVPLKVQIRGGQLEVMRVIEVTATPEAAAVATSTKAVAARTTATATPWSTAAAKPTPTPTSEPTPTETPVKVSVQGDVWCFLDGPDGALASRNPRTGLNAIVQGRDAVQVVVESPSGESIVLLPHGDIYGWERRSSGMIQGLPQAGGTYTFTVLDADGTPIPGTVDSDVYLGGHEPDPPANVQAGVVEDGILVTWEPSPVIPGAFDPLGKPPVGFYQLYLYQEGGQLVYGWHHYRRLLPQTSSLIPYRRRDFGPGDTGRALEELEDGVYHLELNAFSVAPEGTEGYFMECIAFDPAEVVRIVIEGGQVRVKEPSPKPTPALVPSLSGRVTDAATGQGIAGATVEARLAGPYGWDASNATSSDGSYAIFGLGTGDYVVRVIAVGYAREYYDNVTPSREAEIVHVTALRETPGIDFDLTEGGSISGYVYQGDGITPIGGVEVHVQPSGEEVDDGFNASTASDGNYTIEGLALGKYRIRAKAQGWVEQWYDNIHDWDHATDVIVTPPKDTPNINFVLSRGGSISGFVYESDGVTPVRARVGAEGRLPNGEWVGAGAGTETQADGSYVITDLPAWDYIVNARAPGFALEYYDSRHVHDAADKVTVREGSHTSGINFTLDAGGSVTGHAYEEDRVTPIGGVELGAWLSTKEFVAWLGSTNYDGSYTAWLGTGSYLINANASRIGKKYVNEWYDNHYDVNNADPVQVVAPHGTSGIDFYLAKAGSISGHVYEEDGITPIAGASVYAFPIIGDHPGAGANTSSDGSYTIEGLLSGNYRVQATVSDHVAEYYSNAPDEASATEVQVNVPGDTPDIDFALNPRF